jgi:hypothetical protein
LKYVGLSKLIRQVVGSSYAKVCHFCALELTAISQVVSGQERVIKRLEQHPVFTAQFVLNQLSYDAGRVDVDYGPRTAAAISAFYEQTKYEDPDPDQIGLFDLGFLVKETNDTNVFLTPLSFITTPILERLSLRPTCEDFFQHYYYVI